MTQEQDAAAEVFDRIAGDFLGRDDVDMGRMFGTEGLRVRGKVFAFVGSRGVLVVKLPASRIDALEAEQRATRMVMRDRVMREWAAVPLTQEADWPALMAEAHDFLDEITP